MSESLSLIAHRRRNWGDPQLSKTMADLSLAQCKPPSCLVPTGRLAVVGTPPPMVLRPAEKKHIQISCANFPSAEGLTMPTSIRVTQNATAGRTHLRTEAEAVQFQHRQRLKGSLATRRCPCLLLKEMTAPVWRPAPSCLDPRRQPRLPARDAPPQEEQQRSTTARHSTQGLAASRELVASLPTKNRLFQINSVSLQFLFRSVDGLTWSAEAERSSRGTVKGSERVKVMWSRLLFPVYFRVPAIVNELLKLYLYS